MAAPRRVSRKLAKQRYEAQRAKLIANAIKRLPKDKAALLARQKGKGDER